MVARTDLRPTRADDSLKKLLGKVANPQTVPHGVKVAQPGEYVSFYDTDGSAHRWDGDAIAEYDTRIAEGKAAVAAAQAHLAEVEADLEEAKERITASNGDLTLYVERVEAAQAAADTANDALQGLTQNLQTAQTAVDAVANRTGAVESALVDVDTKAAQAASDANDAANAAQNALAASQQVQADAQNALTKAEEAEAKALEAAGIAAGKGKIIYLASEPSGAEESSSNLWIRSSDSKPHRWDGTRWVEVTDKAIVDAAQAAAAAQTTANEAVADAAAAKTAADNAQAAADSAQAAAQSADAKAVSASNAANAAQSTANKAVSDASTAQSAANAADAKALAAAGIADAKGKVIYSTVAPGTADRLSQNLWVRLPDNVPHRWNGTQWVAVTDKTATDAAAAAATAQSAANTAKATADKAVQDAANAASAAQAANVAAGNAQRTADGKTVALFGTATPPPAPGVTQGDLYYRTGPDNRIIEQWQWSGSAWVKRAIESAQLVNFDAAYITSGYLDVAKRIRAGAILADKLTVGIGDNLVPNGNGQAWEGWSAFGWNSAGPATNNGFPGSFWIQGQQTLNSERFPATPGDYRFSVAVKGEGAGQRFYVQVVGYDAAGVRISPAPYPVVNQAVPNGTWQTFTGNITLPGGITQASITVYSQHALGTQDAAKYIWYTGFSLIGMKDGSVIVNGSITGEKVNAESVAAAVGSFVKVNAENVTVTSELAARVVNAMTAQVKNLVVTESAILQHTTLLGETVAEQLNVTKKLVARDAIVNGTLDVEQLNVTEGMSAQIVSAMSLESKKLVVTEDAILNRATVVQSLVTPELIAERINVNTLGAELVISGAIQTDPATNRGIKISNSGIIGYSADGKQTININGSTNRIVGEFSTGAYGEPRVNIYNKFNQLWGIDESIIDMQASGMSGVSSYDNAVTRLTASAREGFTITTGGNRRLVLDSQGAVLSAKYIVLDGSTSMNDATVGGNFQVNGKMNLGRGMTFGWFTGTSLGAGQWVDAEIPLNTTMSGSSPKIFTNVKSANRVPVLCSVWGVSATKFSVRIYNLSPSTATGAMTGEWMAIVAND